MTTVITFPSVEDIHNILLAGREIISISYDGEELQELSKPKKEKEHEPREWKAKFNALDNDLFWKVHFMKERRDERGRLIGFEWFRTTFEGYNDDYWWKNVAPKITRQTITGDKGTELTIEIDFRTCVVKEVIQ